MTQQIIVLTSTQKIVVDRATNMATVVKAGPTGPPGNLSQSQLDAAVASLQSQIDDLQAQINTHHP